mmetsp:Transcript_40099/g.78331  ORF Transcript_40099/g.78331 Transcript_40099/m.78331 type:complete len:266 (+) Transcript_40099:20-817(+)
MVQCESRLVSTAAAIGVLLSIVAPLRAFAPSPTVHPLMITRLREIRAPAARTNGADDGPGDARRAFAARAAGAALVILTAPGDALAGIDVSSLRNLPVDGDASGAAARMKQLQFERTRVERGDPDDRPPTQLPGGVSYRDIKSGKDGGRIVRRGSTVGATMTIRSTASGAAYFSTAEGDGNELAWTLGSGDLPAGLEEGMLGMRLNAVRRIEVPSAQVFAAKNVGQLPEARTEEGRRRYEELFGGDATLVFEVFTTAVSQGDNRI